MGPRAPISPSKSPWTITGAHFRATCPPAGAGLYSFSGFGPLAGFILDRNEESVQLAVGSQSERGSGQRTGQSVLLVFDDKEEVADPVVKSWSQLPKAVGQPIPQQSPLLQTLTELCCKYSRHHPEKKKKEIRHAIPCPHFPSVPAPRLGGLASPGKEAKVLSMDVDYEGAAGVARAL